MNTAKSHTESGERLGRWVLSHKAIVISFSLLIVIIMGLGVKDLKLSFDYRYFFGPNNPHRIAFEEFGKVYAELDSALIVIEHESGTVFNESTLSAIKILTDLSWKVPFSTRVSSISNYQHTEANGDELIIRDLYGGEGAPKLDQEAIDKIKQIATTEPRLLGSIVNSTGNITAINVEVTLPQKSMYEVPEVAGYVKKMVKEWQSKFPGHKVYFSGMVFMNDALNEAGVRDMYTLMPLMALIIIFMMTVLLRSVISVFNTFILIILSVVGAIGFSGWIGIPLTAPSAIAPTIILTLAIADSVHLLKTIFGCMQKGLDKNDAIIEALRINLQPIFLTSLTTVIGFLSLNFSDTPPFNDLGNITAVGITIAFFLSVTLLPVLTAIFPLKINVNKNGKQKQNFTGLSDWVIKRKIPIVITTVAVFIILGIQVPKIEVNDQYVDYLDESIQFRTDTEYIIDKLTGIYQINFDLRSGESQGIARPDFLRHVENFVNYAKSIDGVNHVDSILDTIKQLNMSMNSDDINFYRIPKNRELTSQFLLLYEMSLPYGLDLNDQIDIDKAGTKVTAVLGNLRTKKILDITNRLENWLKNNTPKIMHAKGTSPNIMFSHITERNVETMTLGTLIAFLLISFVLAISLKSIRYGVISLIPNMVPIILAFGIWSLTIGEAGFAIAIVISVTLGIVVDDTVHFLSKYVRARREKGMSAEEAIKNSFDSVGPALVATTAILATGFSILMFSPFLMNWTLGALSALTIVIAFVIDFTFLPAILVLLDKEKVKLK